MGQSLLGIVCWNRCCKLLKGLCDFWGPSVGQYIQDSAIRVLVKGRAKDTQRFMYFQCTHAPSHPKIKVAPSADYLGGLQSRGPCKPAQCQDLSRSLQGPPQKKTEGASALQKPEVIAMRSEAFGHVCGHLPHSWEGNSAGPSAWCRE